ALLTASILPWGPALQAVATTIAMLALCVNALLHDEFGRAALEASRIGFANLAAGFSFALGIFISYRLDRERRRGLESTRRRAASAATFRALVQNAPDTVVIVDFTGRVVFSNRRWKPLAAVDPIGRRLFDFAATFHHEALRRHLHSVFTGGGPVSFELATPAFAEHDPHLYRCRMAALRRPGERLAALAVAAR